MNINTAAILRGGALVSWRGASFYHRGDIELPMTRESIDINDIEPFAVTFRSQDQQMIEANFTPSGRLTEVANLVNRYATTVRGELINIEEFPVTLNASTDVVTVPSGNLLATGDEVMIHWLATAPGGLSRTTRYYWRSASGTTGTLYDTYAHAIDTGSTSGLIDISSAGSAVVLSVSRPLTIHCRNGLKIVYYNAGLVNLPPLRFQAGETLLGECGFRMFVRNAAFSDTSFDPADLPRQSPVVSWDNGTPWSAGLATREGAEVEFELQTEGLPSDAFGEDALGQIFTGLDVSVTAAVQGVTEAEVMAALKQHTASRGSDISGDGALDIDTAVYNFEIADAALVEAPQNFGSANQRGGDFVWRAMPTFNAGAPEPLFELTENE
jgi:hypothetical protein